MKGKGSLPLTPGRKAKLVVPNVSGARALGPKLSNPERGSVQEGQVKGEP